MSRLKHTHLGIPLRVRGRAPFPIDMLRYDCCIPATERDASTIRLLQSADANDLGPEQWTIELIRFVVEPGVPSISRWKSFGWEVIG